MSGLSEGAISRLRHVVEEPDLAGTRYELVERIGEGGMGVVYRVRDPELERDVALKLVRTAESVSAAMERFRREARIVAGLEHPGIVPVHDAGVLADGRPFYVMKLVDGERLDVRAARGLDLPTLLAIAERLCETVAFAHARGVVHRDLKPSNVMVGSFGEVLVLDWGVATQGVAGVRDGERRADAPGRGGIVGTPGWMPPEQAAGEGVDARADVYALGGIVRWLFHHLRTDSGAGDRSPPRPLQAIARKALAEVPGERYADAAALAADLRAFRGGQPVSAYRESALERAGRLAHRYRTPIALVLAYILMRALLLIFAGQ